MPRYFFNVRDGREVPDEVGTELPDMEAVRLQALATSGEMLRESGENQFWSGTDWSMHVLDENGREVLTLRFSAVAR